jgi:hypothetical protein
VPVTFAEYTVRDAGIHQQVQAVLEDASADSLLDFLATVELHLRIRCLLAGEYESCEACDHDGDLGLVIGVRARVISVTTIPFNGF